MTVTADTVQVIGTSSDGKSRSTLTDQQANQGAKGNAGNLNIHTGSLLIQDGASVSAGTLGAGNGGNLTVTADTVKVIGTSGDGKLGSNLSDQAESGATGNAGDLNIKTGSLLIRDGAFVSTSTLGTGKSGNLTVNADTVQVIGTSSDGQLISKLIAQANPSATGNAGDLNIKTGSLLIQDGAFVSTSTLGAGKGGNLSVNADTVQVIGTSSDGKFRSTLTDQQANQGAKGNAGDLKIQTGSLLIQDGAFVSAGTLGAGNGGNLTVTADTVKVIGTSGDRQFISNLSDQAESGATGSAGNLNIQTGSLLIRDGAFVSTSTFGTGKSGNLSVNADTVQVIGTSSDGKFRSTLTDQQANQGAKGNAGDLKIQTGSLLIQDGAFVSAGTLGAGNGGNLTVTADTVKVIGTSGDRQFISNLSDQAESGATGSAGNLKIQTGSLLIRDGAFVSTSTLGAGKGGNLSVNADTVQVIGTSSDGQLISKLIAQANPSATGNAGDLNIKTGSLLIQDGAFVSTSTLGAGKGGNLAVNADTVQVIGIYNDANRSNLTTQAESGARGNAGDLNIKTGSLLIQDGAFVSAGTVGAGKGGNLTVNADTVQVIGTSSDGKLGSNLSVQAESSATGNAGNLNINTGSLLIRDGAFVSANTRSNNTDPNLEQATITLRSRDLILTHGSKITTDARGSNVIGGNIKIDTDVLAAVENSKISADSTDAGGGRVIINTQGLFRSPDSTITATGANPQLNGTVQINTPDIDPSRGLVQLPTITENTPKLVASSCNAFDTGGSSFTVTGRGGLPPSPDQPLTDDVIWTDTRIPASTTQQHSSNKPAAKPHSKPKAEPIVIAPAIGWVFNGNGEVTLISSTPSANSLGTTPATCPTQK